MRPRFTIRTLLIVVAVVALAIGGWQMWERRQHCLERAAFFGAKLDAAELGYRRTLDAATASRTPLALRRVQQYMALYRDATDRYGRVARCPWLPLPVEPDPR